MHLCTFKKEISWNWELLRLVIQSKSSKRHHAGREGGRQQVKIYYHETTVHFSPAIDRQSKCLSGDRQNTSWWLEDDQLRCLHNGRTKCTLTVSCRNPDKLGCRSNSLCFWAAHTSSYVSTKFCTFRCLVGDVCQRYGPLTHNAVWKPWVSLK
jgi:hypothetical protein